MSEQKRSIGEHLEDASLYMRCKLAGNGSGALAGGEWRRRLLAKHSPPLRRLRPAGGLSPELRLRLLITLPLAACALLTIYSMGGAEIVSAWFPRFSLPSLPELSFGSFTSGELAALRGKLFAWRFAGQPLWLPLTLLGGGLSTLITFAVRGRAPRMLPLDW